MSGNVIIFDGPDGCGKTNISSALSSLLKIPVFKNEFEWDHFEVKTKNDYFIKAIKYQHPYLLSYIKQTGSSVIFDRAHPSEFVYPKVFNRDTDERSLQICDDMSASLGAKIIIPYRSSYEGVEDEYGVTPEHLLEIDRGYKEFAKWTKCDTFFLNVDDEDLDRELKEIMEFLS